MEYVEGLKNRLRDIGDWAYNCRKRLDRAGAGVAVLGMAIFFGRDFCYRNVPVPADLGRYNSVINEIGELDRTPLGELRRSGRVQASLDSLAMLEEERGMLDKGVATTYERIGYDERVAEREKKIENLATYGIVVMWAGIGIFGGNGVIAGRVGKRRKTMR